MTWSSSVALAVLAVSAVAYFVVATTIAAFGDRVASLSFADRNSGDEPPRSRQPLFLSTNALIMGRALQGGALLAAALSTYAALNPVLTGGSGEALGLLISGLTTTSGAALLQVLAWVVAAANPSAARSGLAPVASALHAVSALLTMAGLTRLIRFRSAEQSGESAAPTAEQEVSAALKENLEILEQARIPIQQEELRMIRSILRMDTVRVREIMRPRVDILAAPVGSTAAELISIMSSGGHSKLPVFEGTLDNIVGVVYARDVLAASEKAEGAGPGARDLARQPVFVPESQNLERLLREFRQRRTGIAIVVDEYGGVSGLVTVSDFIEEIVGKMLDEFDTDEAEVRRVSETEVIVDGALPLDALNDALGLTLKGHGFDTVAGLVYRELGTVPQAGDTVVVGDITMKVESVAGRRVRQIKVTRRPPSPDGAHPGHMVEGI
jgi:CBS domain containing-hemolysin-like protein